jgi:hypothetical protein
VQFHGEDAGFEYYSRAVNEEERAETGTPPGVDFVVTLVTHSDLRELACSLVASGVLCYVSGGMLFDPDSGESFPPDRALGWVKEQLAEVEPELD